MKCVGTMKNRRKPGCTGGKMKLKGLYAEITLNTRMTMPDSRWYTLKICLIKYELRGDITMVQGKVIMQGKLFQKCTHLLYCNVLFLGGNVNTRRMSKPDMGSIFHIKNQ